MFTKIVFKKNFNNWSLGSSIRFRPGVNLVVGDQGCGKSSLLKQLGLFALNLSGKNHSDRITGSTADLAIDAAFYPCKGVSFFDFEKNNPRTAPAFDMFGIGMETQIAAMWSSHGEFVRSTMNALRRAPEGAVFVLDEPDMALSPRSIHEMVDNFKNIAEKNQIIASVHNPLLIASFPEVCSLEHGQWMKSHEFLESQATTPAPTWDRKTPRMIKIYSHDLKL